MVHPSNRLSVSKLSDIATITNFSIPLLLAQKVDKYFKATSLRFGMIYNYKFISDFPGKRTVIICQNLAMLG